MPQCIVRTRKGDTVIHHMTMVVLNSASTPVTMLPRTYLFYYFFRIYITMVSLTIANSRAVTCHSHAVITTYCHPFPLFYFRTFPLWVVLFFLYCSPESQYFELSHHTIFKPSSRRSLTSALFPPAEVSITLHSPLLFPSDFST